MRQANKRQRAKRYVSRHFPALRDVEPVHSTRSHKGTKLDVYTFKKEFSVEGGTLVRVVRVSVDAEGKIAKAVSSR